MDLGKPPRGREKLVFGIIDCTKSTIESLEWQECKTCVGQLDRIKSYAYHPFTGTKNCHLFKQPKEYTSSIQLEVGDQLGMLLNKNDGTLSFFHNGNDFGVAFDNIQSDNLLPAISIRDRAQIRLCFPPPPYTKRNLDLSSPGIPLQRYRART